MAYLYHLTKCLLCIGISVFLSLYFIIWEKAVSLNRWLWILIMMQTYKLNLGSDCFVLKHIHTLNCTGVFQVT